MTLPPNLPPKIDRQREHQANERTFLAWLRTSIALIGFGFAIARFGLFINQLELALGQERTSPSPVINSENLGIALVVLGIVAIAIAAWRYNQVFWQIERGDYRPNRLVVWATTVLVMALGILSIPLIWRQPNPRQPLPPSSLRK
jgi:putative membrane protein